MRGSRVLQRSDIGVERGCEIALKVGCVTALENVSHPGLALERLKAHVPDTRRQARRRDVSELVRVSGGRDKDMMVQFIFVRPEIEKDEIGGSAVVHAEKAKMIVRQLNWQ